ncbi:MAG TPA: TetR/AcrR family transcriptional regulator [Candidatus Limnocylindrales bacterium]|nr:TetR/AcrR family transcriptional regulator [Candidatus Limnocylindrales bacterium]
MVARQGHPGGPFGSNATANGSARRAVRPPGRPRSEEAHRAILDATRELLVEEGFTRLRLEHVAARAGVGKGTIYRRWPSKEALTLDLVLELADPHLDIADAGDTRAELLAAVRNPLDAIVATEWGPVIRAMLSQIAGNPVIGDPFRVAVVARRRAEVRHVIERGIARGDLRPDADASIATELLVGPVYFRLAFGGTLDEDFGARIADAVFAAFRAG